jgi:hypothetical protein
MNLIMENKFDEGSVVYALASPTVALVIRRYVERVYYCQVKDQPDLKELVYFERELKSETA